jgi:Papain-like cysteine protease AvrRpt2
MILNYQTQEQLLDDWCWAAVASSISIFYSPSSQWTQSALGGALLNPVCSRITSDNASTAQAVCRQTLDLSNVLSSINNLAWVVNQPLSLEQIQGQISSGWPICCEMTWPSGQSHVITLYGFSDSLIIIGDPEGGVFSADYEDLVSDYRSGGQWIRSVGTKPGQ